MQIRQMNRGANTDGDGSAIEAKIMTTVPSGDAIRRNSARVYDGPDRAGARAMLRAFGVTDEELARPHVGVAATWNRVTPCNAGLDVIRARAAQVLSEAGVLPFEFDTI